MKYPHSTRFAVLCVSLFLGFGCDDVGSPSTGTADTIVPGDSMDVSLSDPMPDGGDVPDTDAGDPPIETVECSGDLILPESGICDTVEGTGAGVLIQGTILGAEGPIVGGTVLLEGNTIQCVGCDCSEQPAYAQATRIHCGHAVVSPGLINPHDHITFTEGHPIDHGDTRYDHRHEWRRALSTPSNSHGTNETSNGNRWGEIRMALSGVTSLVGSGSANGMIRNLDRLETVDRDEGFDQVRFQTFSLGDANRQFKRNCGWDYRYTELEAAEFSAFIPHVAEGIDNYAQEEFRCQSTSFDGGQDFTEKNAAHIHSIGLTAADYYKMARENTKLIWSPRSNISLYGTTAEIRIFAQLGGILSIGTDWTYSGSANMLRELVCADEWNRDYLDGYFSDKDLWDMATINAAISTNTQDLIGSLETGKIADVAIFAAEEGETYRAVLEAGNTDVALVLKSGQPLLGERDTVSALEGCDDLDVCGAEYAICTTREFGVSFQTILNDVSSGRAAYPAIFCEETPESEPTCVPSRPGEFSGERNADDLDGDGVPNVDDNCPRVFNPPMPYTGNVQADSDGDGTGDGCDAQPLSEDLDGDMVSNAEDNCPFDANQSQEDEDDDDKGDLCDICPAESNPDSICPPAPAMEVSIQDIQSGDVDEETSVALRNVVVTATWSRGLWVQSAGGGPLSGISLYTGSDAGDIAAVGDVVDVEGLVNEYYGDTQLANARVTPVGMSMDPVVTDVTVSQAAQEDFEGVLVTVTDATLSNAEYDCGQDNDNCSDAGLWAVVGRGGSDDVLLVFDRLYAGDTWAEHIASGPITGILAYRFDQRRIMPRGPEDFSSGTE